MCQGVTPSAELTGGPFYDGHNIDVGLISDLSSVALRFVVEKVSIPSGNKYKQRQPLMTDICHVIEFPAKDPQAEQHPRQHLRPEPHLRSLSYLQTSRPCDHPLLFRETRHLQDQARGRTYHPNHEHVGVRRSGGDPQAHQEDARGGLEF